MPAFGLIGVPAVDVIRIRVAEGGQLGRVAADYGGTGSDKVSLDQSRTLASGGYWGINSKNLSSNDPKHERYDDVIYIS